MAASLPSEGYFPLMLQATRDIICKIKFFGGHGVIHHACFAFRKCCTFEAKIDIKRNLIISLKNFFKKLLTKLVSSDIIA